MNISKAASRDHKIDKRTKVRKPHTIGDDKRKEKITDKQKRERVKYKYGD